MANIRSAKSPSTPVAEKVQEPAKQNSLLIPVYSVEDAKAARQQLKDVHLLCKRFNCSSVTFEMPSGRLSEIQEVLGPYSSSLKLYYRVRRDEDGYIFHRLPHYKAPAERPAAVRERTRYVEKPAAGPAAKNDPEPEPQGVMATPIAKARGKRS